MFADLQPKDAKIGAFKIYQQNLVTRLHVDSYKQLVGKDLFSYFSYLLIFIYLVIIGWSATVPWLSRYHESHSSAHTLVAGEHFAETGFMACKLLPIFQPGKLYSNKDRFYTHYPPFTAIINGVIRKLGFDSLLAFRLPFVFLGASAIWLWFLFMRKLYNSKVAFFSLCFLVALPEYYRGLYDTFGFSLDQFCRFAGIYLIYRWFNEKEENRKRIYFFLWAVLFIQSINSFEYIVYLQLFIWLYAFMFKAPGSDKKKLSGLALAPVLGLLLHLLQNIWALGISGAFLDVDKAFRHRTGILNGTHYFTVFSHKSIRRFFVRFVGIMGIDVPQKPGNNDWVVLLVCLLIPIILFSLKELNKTPGGKKFRQYFTIFFLCDISWYLMFPQHTFHTHLVKNMIPSVVFTAGIFFNLNLELYQKLKSSKSLWLAFRSVMIVCLFFLMFGYKLSGLGKAVRNNFLRADLPYYLSDFKELLPIDAICLTNVQDGCLLRYYLERKTFALHRLTKLEQKIRELKKKPYFKKDRLFLIYRFGAFASPKKLKRRLPPQAEMIGKKKIGKTLVAVYQLYPPFSLNPVYE